VTGLTLDAGALIAYERKHRAVILILKRAFDNDGEVVIPAPALAQAWRDGRQQVQLVRLLAAPQVQVEPLDDRRARAAGQLCGATATSDIVHASVILCARARKHMIVTSDRDDLQRLDPNVTLIDC
jgi:hypothetical protein